MALVGVTLALPGLIVGVDAIRFHSADLMNAVVALPLGDVRPRGLAMLALLLASGAVVAIAVRSVLRQAIAQRRRMRGLRVIGTNVVDGRCIHVVADARPVAFCSGLLRPRIYLSRGALEILDGDELRAVVAHEAHHLARRDPLRLLVARAVASAVAGIPVISTLGRRQAELAELAADAAAVQLLGTARPLAGALLAFDRSGADQIVGIAAARVDHLVGESDTEGVSGAVLAVAILIFGGLLGIALLLALSPTHPELLFSADPLCVAAAAILAGSGWLGTQRLAQDSQPHVRHSGY